MIINFTRLHSHQPCLHDSSIDDWSEACLYKCHICWSFTTTSRDLFCKHLGDAHAGVSESDYIVRMRCNFRCLCTVSSKTWPFQNEYSSLTFLESYIECKRCGAPVLHNKDSIEKHREVIVSNLSPFFMCLNFIMNFCFQGSRVRSEDTKGDDSRRPSVQCRHPVSVQTIVGNGVTKYRIGHHRGVTDEIPTLP